MTNKTLSGQESKNKLLEGIKIINDAVSITLGPAGRNVLIENEDGTIRITKDGVTVANSLKKLDDPISNMGVQLIKQVANKSADKAGDGTTTSTLLATVLVQEGIKTITQGSNAVEVKKGIDKAVKIVVDKLKSISKDISSPDQIKQVATLSANNDAEIGSIIALALENAGVDGIVTIEESKTGETFLDKVEGMSLDRGYRSPYFVNDNTTMQAILEEPRILIYDGIINAGKELLPFWEYTATAGKPLLVISQDIDGEALATFLLNKTRGTIKGAAVKSPEFGERRTHILNDIAIVTGGKVLSRELGDRLENFAKPELKLRIDEVLGTCRLATVSKDTTTLIDGKGEKDKIENRLYELKEQIDKATSNFEIERLQERLAKMIGGVSIIHIGGASEVEMKERKDRVDDALHATKAAIEEGIVPGGGMALINCLDALVDNGNAEGNNEQLGFDIVRKALKAPFKKILENAGVEDHYRILADIKSMLPDDEAELFGWEGYNVKTGEYENFFKSGVLDPTKVTRNAIENAASVAGVILTTESVIYLEKSKEDEEGDQFGGMNDFM